MFDKLHKFSYLWGIINAFQQQVEFIRIPITFSSSCDDTHSAIQEWQYYQPPLFLEMY